MDQLGLGIAGCGDAAYSFATAAGFLKDWKPVAAGGALTREEERAFAEKHGLEVRTVEEMAASRDIEVIAVATPPGVHVKDALIALAGGKHVIVEKPFALTLEDCDRMIEAAAKAGCQLMVGQTMRYFAGMIRMRELIASGELGRLLMIEESAIINYFGPKRTGWQLDRSLSGGGVVLNPVIHLTDRLRYYTGSEVKSVRANIGAAKKGFAIEGHVQVFYEFFEPGVSAALTLYGYGRTSLDRTLIFLENGVIRSDFSDNRITVYAENDVVRVERPDPMPFGPGRIISGYVQQLAEFRESIKKGAPHRSDGRNGRANVAVCLAILESAAKGKPVQPKTG